MILNIYAVRDRATNQYGNPMFLVNHGHAIRSFQSEVNRADKDNALHQYADDFDLYHLGSYDTDLGTFVTKFPEQIAVGKDLKS